MGNIQITHETVEMAVSIARLSAGPDPNPSEDEWMLVDPGITPLQLMVRMASDTLLSSDRAIQEAAGYTAMQVADALEPRTDPLFVRDLIKPAKDELVKLQDTYLSSERRQIFAQLRGIVAVRNFRLLYGMELAKIMTVPLALEWPRLHYFCGILSEATMQLALPDSDPA